jgi:hypothetical protein
VNQCESISTVVGLTIASANHDVDGFKAMLHDHLGDSAALERLLMSALALLRTALKDINEGDRWWMTPEEWLQEIALTVAEVDA